MELVPVSAVGVGLATEGPKPVVAEVAVEVLAAAAATVQHCLAFAVPPAVGFVHQFHGPCPLLYLFLLADPWLLEKCTSIAEFKNSVNNKNLFAEHQ